MNIMMFYSTNCCIKSELIGSDERWGSARDSVGAKSTVQKKSERGREVLVE
jgi:hypothetical protein